MELKHKVLYLFFLITQQNRTYLSTWGVRFLKRNIISIWLLKDRGMGSAYVTIMVSNIWVGMSILIFIYSNSKFKVTCKNTDFEFWYIRTHTVEKSSKISNITFSILPFSYKNTLTKLPSWVLWSLLLLTKPSDVLQNGSFQGKERKI